jgi:hypothetical protein
VAVGGQTALVASTTSTGTDPSGGVARIEVVDISNPGSMKALGELDIRQATIATAIAIQGNTALVVGNTKGWRNPGNPNFDSTGFMTLSLLDISNPRSPTVVSTQVTSFQTDVDQGNVVAPLENGFFALTISPPAPTTTGFVPTVGIGHLAIVDARSPQNLKITTAADIPLVTEISVPSGQLAVSGNKLYVATANGLSIYQISTGP